jgi:hypothetical protein
MLLCLVTLARFTSYCQQKYKLPIHPTQKVKRRLSNKSESKIIIIHSQFNYVKRFITPKKGNTIFFIVHCILNALQI